jgi:hypothetical protein
MDKTLQNFSSLTREKRERVLKLIKDPSAGRVGEYKVKTNSKGQQYVITYDKTDPFESVGPFDEVKSAAAVWRQQRDAFIRRVLGLILAVTASVQGTALIFLWPTGFKSLTGTFPTVSDPVHRGPGTLSGNPETPVQLPMKNPGTTRPRPEIVPAPEGPAGNLASHHKTAGADHRRLETFPDVLAGRPETPGNAQESTQQTLEKNREGSTPGLTNKTITNPLPIVLRVPANVKSEPDLHAIECDGSLPASSETFPSRVVDLPIVFFSNGCLQGAAASISPAPHMLGHNSNQLDPGLHLSGKTSEGRDVDPETLPFRPEGLVPNSQIPSTPAGFWKSPTTIEELWQSVSAGFPNAPKSISETNGSHTETLSVDLRKWTEYAEVVPCTIPERWQRNWRAGYADRVRPHALSPYSLVATPAIELGHVTSVCWRTTRDGGEQLEFHSPNPAALLAAVSVLYCGDQDAPATLWVDDGWIVHPTAHGVVLVSKSAGQSKGQR